jgi:hypothetical protein
MSNTQHATGTPEEQSARSTAETAGEPYTFTGVDGKEYVLPDRSTIKAGLIRKTRHLPELDQAFTILEGLLKDDPKTLDALDELDGERFNLVVMGWQAHLGANPGK